MCTRIGPNLLLLRSDIAHFREEDSLQELLQQGGRGISLRGIVCVREEL